MQSSPQSGDATGGTVMASRLKKAAIAALGGVGLAMSAAPAFAAEACNKVRVMVTAGPEEDVLAKHAKSDFEKQTGIQAAIETVSRDLWPARAAREFTTDKAEFDL